MDSRLFTEKINRLGKLKRQYRGNSPQDDAYEDRIFVPNKIIIPCPDCFSLGRSLHYEIRFDQKNNRFWRTKCGYCKSTWPGLRL